MICIEPDIGSKQPVGESLDWSSPALLAALGLPMDRLILGTGPFGLRPFSPRSQPVAVAEALAHFFGRDERAGLPPIVAAAGVGAA